MRLAIPTHFLTRGYKLYLLFSQLRIVNVLRIKSCILCETLQLNKYRHSRSAITFKSHSLGPFDHACPLRRSSQLSIDIPLLLNHQCFFDFLVCIFHPGDQLILRLRIYCLVLPNCQDYGICFDQGRITHFQSIISLTIHTAVQGF